MLGGTMTTIKVCFSGSAINVARRRSARAPRVLTLVALLLGFYLEVASATDARAADASSSSAPRMTITGPGSAAVYVLTQHNDIGRTGVNPDETILTPSTISDSSFGELWRLPVDDQINAQPLYVGNASVLGQSSAKNVLIVATLNNTIYAFDADSSSPIPLWSRHFDPPH